MTTGYEPPTAPLGPVPGPAPVSPGPARAIGVLNIIFGVALMLGGACCGLYGVMLPASLRVAGPRIEQIDELREQEEAAATPQEKDELRRRREQATAQLGPERIDQIRPLLKLHLEDPRFTGHFLVEVATLYIFNVLMVVTGIGLVRVREWGRRLGVWVAALKIARLAALTASFFLIVVPHLTANLPDVAAEQVRLGQLPRDADPDALARSYARLLAVYQLSTLVLGAIYPIISLIVLTRPGVRAACLGPAAMPPPSPAW